MSIQVRLAIEVHPITFDHPMLSVKAVEHSLYVGFPVEVEGGFGQYQMVIVVASLDD